MAALHILFIDTPILLHQDAICCDQVHPQEVIYLLFSETCLHLVSMQSIIVRCHNFHLILEHELSGGHGADGVRALQEGWPHA
jgi:hypothetical protein